MKVIYHLWLKVKPQTWFKKFSLVMTDFESLQCKADHFVFIQHGTVILIVYGDDMLIELTRQVHCNAKDLGCSKYFFGIEIAHSKLEVPFLKENALVYLK